MNTSQFSMFAKQLHKLPELSGCARFYIVALDRSEPGLCSGGVVVDAAHRKLRLRFRRGTFYPAYDGSDDVFEDDGLSDEDDETPDDCIEWNGSTISFSAEDGTQKEAEAYRIPGLDGDPHIFFHVTRSRTGVTIKEDFALVPIVYLNAGKEPVKVDGKTLRRHEYLTELPASPARAERLRVQNEAFNALNAYQNAQIERNRVCLRCFGCPEGDVEALARYFCFCCSPAYATVEDYPSRPHEAWMEEVPRVKR